MELTMNRLAEEELMLQNRNKFDVMNRMEFIPDPPVDTVNHPPHYNNSQAKCSCGRRIECIDVTRHLSFNIGNAMKYLWRCELKGNTLEDLKKAQWYIQDEIKKRES